MSYNLFLDDERNPADVVWVRMPKDMKSADTVIVRNYQEFVDCITQNGLPDAVSFDHDLADQHYQAMLQENDPANTYTHDDGDLRRTYHYGPEKTGYDCAKWLVDYCIDNEGKLPEYTVHSMNPVGAQRISNYLENAKRKAGV